jgi:hypothetical protein
MTPEQPQVVGDEAGPAEDNLTAYSEDGVDLTLIHWMLSMTPAERLLTLQQAVQSLAEMLNARSQN